MQTLSASFLAHVVTFKVQSLFIKGRMPFSPNLYFSFFNLLNVGTMDLLLRDYHTVIF